MIIKIRKSKLSKIISSFILVNMLVEIFSPTVAMALTGGPSQPEVQSFQPIGTSDMVDVFTGDFNYNIPLVDVGGYPINISYNSGATMDQEASWVGLGWNVNPGVITRNMRGLPDDFSGESVHQEFNMEPNRSYGASLSLSAGEVFGLDFLTLGYSLGINYNNYNGIGFEQSVNASISASSGGSEDGTASLGLRLTAQPEGLDVSPSLSFSEKSKGKQGEDVKTGMTLGVSMNARSGLKAMTLSLDGETKKGYSSDKTRFSGGNTASPISLMPNTYVPQMDFPRLNTSVSLSVKWKATVFGVDVDFTIGGYYSENRLLETSKDLQAYGYLYEQNGGGREDLMLDFNREKDGPFSKNTTNLPLTNHTYDVYSIAGQGIGGMFRPFRGDVGNVYDSKVNSISGSGTLGLELGVGNTAHLGVDGSLNAVTSTSGKWTSGNQILGKLNFQSASAHNVYEPSYFKQAGEKSVDDEPAFKTSIGNYKAVKIPLISAGFQSKTDNKFVANDGTVTTVSGALKRTKRVKRNQSISYMTKRDAQYYGVEGYTSAYGKAYHLSEMSVVRTDGARYVYGIPAYNITQKEVSFNASGNSYSCTDGLVSYTAGDASSGNSNGLDHYYNATTTPAFAHSYLLTAVLSPDYVDVDNIRGPSKGDLGGYTQFVYDGDAAAPGNQPSISNYRWRTPYESGKANYSQGLKTDQSDDRGSYIYGEKELWYLDRIETKTHVAVFHKTKRSDGWEVAGETGGIASGQDATLKLDSISLFSYPDWKMNGSNAVPIKRVHFRYEYKLCGSSGVPLPNNNGTAIDENGNNPSISGKPNINANKGKLTLTKLYFTYGFSRKGKLSGYEFFYSDPDHNGTANTNYTYSLKGYDRWGNYLPNVTNATCNTVTGNLPNADFPYVRQDRALTDLHATAWNMTEIKLPSGGKIEIDYEADDYAYVQDKPAMQMFKISGCGASASAVPTSGNTLYSGSTPNRFFFFKLQTPGVFSSADYIKNLVNEHVYFRFLVDLIDGGTADSHEYVSGYGQILSAGISSSNSNYGYIEMKNVTQGDGVASSTAVSPVAKAAWYFGRMNNPKLVYGLPDPADGTGVEDVIQGLVNSNLIQQVVDLFKGANGEFRMKDYASNFVQDKSWVRLYSPENKLGGGCRVKQLRMYDDWDNMNTASGVESFYGQEYSYNLEDGVTSSGVAAYEPLSGGDENVFRQPIFMTEKHLLASSVTSYVEEPFGESFFPSPSVGYGRVTVKNLVRKNGGGTQIVKKHATGYVVHEFYTAKDFPVLTERTSLDPLPQKSNPLASIFGISVKDYMTATQGYSIELNDMHGKPKAQWVYAEDQDSPISGVEYKYQTSGGKLNNTVVVIDKDKAVTYKEVGVDFDFITDFRESSTKSYTVTTQGNLAAFLVSILPIAVPTIWPHVATQKTRFRSAVATKVINRYGILKETIAHDLGSVVSTENVAYDSETGSVLLTKTNNEFNDPVYNFNYPAHWAYDRMGQAYKSLDYVLDLAVGTGGNIGKVDASANPGYAKGIVSKGDEVIVYPQYKKAWVWDTDEDVTNNFWLIDQDGALVNGGSSFRIIRSGRRNMQETPIGTITSAMNPLVDSNSDSFYDMLDFDAANTKILNASMSEYSENWGIFCDEKAKFNALQTNWYPDPVVIGQFNDIFDKVSSTGFMNPTSLSMAYFPDLYNADVTAMNPTPTTQVNWSTSTICTGCAPNGKMEVTFDAVPNNTLYNVATGLFQPVDASGMTTTLPSGFTWDDAVSVHIVSPSGNANFPNTCNGPVYYALCEILFDNGTATHTGNAVFSVYGEYVFGTCGTSSGCDPLAGTELNPYVAGIKGNWRPYKSHTYLSDRNHLIASNNTNIRHDGDYVSFDNFWNSPVVTGQGNPWTKSTTNWTSTTEVSKYSPYGFEIENKDALNRYSAAVYGYNNTLPKAVSANARYNQVAFDGFEDYSFINQSVCCKGQFDFYDDRLKLVQTESHTGRYSMRLTPSGSAPLNEIEMERSLITAAPASGADDVPYTVKGTDINPQFGPQTYDVPVGLVGTEYVASYWVKQAKANNERVFDYASTQMNIYVNGVLRVPTAIQKSNIIDGWQRVEYRFSILSGDTGPFKVEFINSDATLDAYIDDVRIQPFLSSLKTYVYDPVSLRLWAELDERNFATLYEYDEEGILLRIKKETERGIMTIKETRNHTVKKP